MKRKYNEFDIHLGNLLREYRKERKLTMEYVGERIGCTKQAVSRYELGINALSVHVLMQICDIYKINYGDVIRKAGEMCESNEYK